MNYRINRQERHRQFFAFFLISAGKGSPLVTLLTFSWRYRQNNSLDLTNLELINSTQSFINSLSLFWREVGSLLAGWAKLLAGQLGHFWWAWQKARMIFGPMDGVITFLQLNMLLARTQTCARYQEISNMRSYV